MKPELLARIQPKSIDARDVPGEGFQTLRPADLMHALSGLSTGPYLTVMASIAKLDGARDELVRELLLICSEWHIRPYKPGWLRTVSRIAVDEFCAPEVCLICRGEGSRLIEGQGLAECQGCGGSGYGGTNDLHRSRLAGTEIDEWAEFGRPLLDRLYSRLVGWYSTALDHASHKLGQG